MTAVELLDELDARGAQVAVDGGQLRILAPKASLTAELRSALIARKDEILALLREANGEGMAPPMLRTFRPEILPLSFAQQRLWSIEQQKGASATYNIPIAVRIEGALDTTILTRCFDEIIGRHEALRTTFRQQNGTARQFIADQLRIELRQVNLFREGKDSDREVDLRARISAEISQPFDLETGPLVRLTLFTVGNEEFVLVITIHHIVADGWSMGVLIVELAELYDAFSRGMPSPLEPLSIGYADFALWQREWLQGEVLQRELQYWKKQISGAPALDLPLDFTRPAILSTRGRTFRFELTHTLSMRIREFSRQEGVTVFMVLLAAFNVLLARYSGQEEIVIGSPIANRNRREIEPLIGFFVNSLVLRSDLTGNPDFLEVVRRTRKIALAAFEHQDLPFERVVDELQTDRNLDQHPLFHVLFALQNAPQKDVRLGDLRVGLIPLDTATAKFDLYLSMEERGGQFLGAFEYSTDLFLEVTIARMARHFRRILECGLADSRYRISEIELLSEDEMRRVTLEWNATRRDYPSDVAVHRLFESIVSEQPLASALTIGSRTLSYAALNARANRLAAQMQEVCPALGQPGTFVGICMERSAELLIAMLAVLKTGGAYVPLDPAYPSNRLKSILDEAAAPLVLTCESHRLKIASDARVLTLDSDNDWDRDEDPGNLASEVSGGFPAYLMYTSGSTGSPKGVCIPHRGIVRLVRSPNYVEIASDDVFLHLSPPSFDASTFEVWGALLNGCKVALLPAGTPSLEEIEAAVRNYQVTILWLTGGLFHLMIDERLSALKTVRQLLAGGEALSVAHVRRVFAAYPNIVVINGYGPTESTTFACCHRMLRSPDLGASVPIGRPIANTRAYIVDSSFRPTPVSIPGELVLAGDGLAHNYHQRPDATAERFIPDPFGQIGGERLYRTGDKARWLPNGTIEFLGRLDEQVKVRGFRIEPSEIVSALNECPEVKESVVIGQDDERGRKRLIAYVVPDINHTAEERGALQSEHIASWKALYKETYEGAAEVADPIFNTAGWNSTYTGEPIPADEMHQWVEATVSRIRALSPKRVIEIGCGTGLLLFQLAPDCERYLGTDFSESALAQLTGFVNQRRDFGHVQLLNAAADDFHAIENHDCDTIILNSVVQYFPSVEYLRRVVRGVIAKVRSLGSIFIGDVRVFPLLAAYHASVEVANASAALTAAQLADRVMHRINQEQELVIDPAFFLALQREEPRILGVRIEPKRGRARNELTKFRCDVTLLVDRAPAEHAQISWQDWSSETWSLDGIRQELENHPTAFWGLRGILNARLEDESHIVSWMLDCPAGETLRHLNDTLCALRGRAIDPDALCSLASDLGLRAEIACSLATPFSFDAVFLPSEAACNVQFFNGESPLASSQWGNDPLRNKRTRTLTRRLRDLLAQNLPEYMVPSTIVLLDRMPLTPNGKVDRRALPAVDRSAAEERYTAPRTGTEQTLAHLWSEVLGVDRVGVHDNFFELGGDSILSIQVASRGADLGLQLNTRLIFQHQTIAELAAALRDEPPSEGSTEEVRPSGEVPLSPIQSWFFDLELERPEHFNLATFFITCPGLDSARLHGALQRVANYHDSLRLRFERTKGSWCQRYSDNADLVDFRIIAEWDAAGLGQRAAEFQAGFDLAQGPLLRAILFLGQEGGEGRLLLIVHHLIADGISMRILVEDLVELYENWDLAEPPSPKSNSFLWWSSALQRLAVSDALESECEYWRRRLNQPAGCVPLDAQVETPPGGQGLVRRALAQEEARRLLREIPGQYDAQLRDLLISALAVALSQWSGQPDQQIDLEGHGRNALPNGNVSRTIGWFTSLFPVWLSVPPGTAPEVLVEIRAQLRAVPNDGVGYGLLRYLRRPEEALPSSTQSQVSFNYLGQFDKKVTSNGVISLSRDPTGPTEDPRTKPRYRLAIEARVIDGVLEFEFAFRERWHRRESIEHFADLFLEQLRLFLAPQGKASVSLSTFDIELSETEYVQISELAARFAQ